MVKLIIAGHGAKDSGAINPITGMKESRANLNVALKLEELEKAKGHTVYMFRREHDEPKDKNGKQLYGNDIINAQMAMIRKIKADVVINIHHNAGGGYGAEICVQNKSNLRKKSVDFASNVLSEFKKLGQTIHGTGIVMQESGSRPGYSYFGVLRAAEEVGSVSIITEFGYIDTNDAKDFDTFTEQWAEAQAISNAMK